MFYQVYQGSPVRPSIQPIKTTYVPTTAFVHSNHKKSQMRESGLTTKSYASFKPDPEVERIIKKYSNGSVNHTPVTHQRVENFESPMVNEFNQSKISEPEQNQIVFRARKTPYPSEQIEYQPIDYSLVSFIYTIEFILLMKKQNFIDLPLEQRKQEFQKVSEKKNEYIAIILEPHPKFGQDTYIKLALPGDKKVSEILTWIREKKTITLNNSLYLFHHNGNCKELVLLQMQSEIQNVPVSEDGFRYLLYSKQDSFGLY
ncbi:hypothetical protein pb186bvf_004221 [Paramecium bursaria]